MHAMLNDRKGSAPMSRTDQILACTFYAIIALLLPVNILINAVL